MQDGNVAVGGNGNLARGGPSTVSEIYKRKKCKNAQKNNYSGPVRDSCSVVSFYIRWSERIGRRSDPTNETTRAGAEDAEYRSGSDTKEGERLLLGF